VNGSSDPGSPRPNEQGAANHRSAFFFASKAGPDGSIWGMRAGPDRPKLRKMHTIPAFTAFQCRNI